MGKHITGLYIFRKAIARLKPLEGCLPRRNPQRYQPLLAALAYYDKALLTSTKLIDRQGHEFRNTKTRGVENFQ